MYRVKICYEYIVTICYEYIVKICYEYIVDNFKDYIFLIKVALRLHKAAIPTGLSYKQFTKVPQIGEMYAGAQGVVQYSNIICKFKLLGLLKLASINYSFIMYRLTMTNLQKGGVRSTVVALDYWSTGQVIDPVPGHDS